MSNSNNPLISGSGVGNYDISVTRMHTEIGAIICFVGWLGLAFLLREQTFNYADLHVPQSYIFFSPAYKFGSVSYAMIIVGIVHAISTIYVGVVVVRRIKASMVNVYDDKVKGVAVNKDFSITKLIYWWIGWDKARLTNFDLAFNQITSVDLVTDNAIIINTSGANYKCFVLNGSKIQDFINNKIRNG